MKVDEIMKLKKELNGMYINLRTHKGTSYKVMKKYKMKKIINHYYKFIEFSNILDMCKLDEDDINTLHTIKVQHERFKKLV